MKIQNLVKQSLFLSIFMFISCGPSEFEYVNAPDRQETLDEAAVASQSQVQSSDAFIFEATPNPAKVDQAISFVASCQLGDGKVIEFDFGDGSSPQIGSSLKHAYQTEGTYQVKATCTDGEKKLEAQAMIQVSNDKGPNQM